MDNQKLDLLVRLLLERKSVRDAADELGISHTTAYKMLSRIEILTR